MGEPQQNANAPIPNAPIPNEDDEADDDQKQPMTETQRNRGNQHIIMHCYVTKY